MADTYDLTGNQRDAWRARVLPLFTKENNCFNLAERCGHEEEKSKKNAAGYIGEFRDGKSRALRYFLGEPARLRKLARALDTSVETLETFWREVREGETNGTGTLWIPGFEDWGPVSLDDGFVAPPMVEATRPLRAFDPTLLSRLENGLSIFGAPGAGVTTLLRRIASWAESDGWHVTWGIGGGLPDGRASLLVIDGHDVGDPAALKNWAKAPGHALLRGSDGFTPWRHVTGGTIVLGSTALRILPVDAAWLDRFVDTVARMAPRGEATRLRALPLGPVLAALDTLAAPSPELAGCLLRTVLDGQRPDVARQGVRYVLDAAHRRLVGQRRREHVALLRRGEDWLSSAYLGWVAQPQAPVSAPLELALLDRARTALAEIQATEEQRELLRVVLPFASGSQVVESLGDAGIVQEADNGATHFRMEGLLAPALAHRVIANPDVLRAAMLHRRRALLGAVARAPGGPAALAAVLRTLDAPSLAVALGSLDRDADWLVRVTWDAALVARVLAAWLVTGEVEMSFLRAGLSGKRRIATMPPLWDVFANAGAPPTTEVLQREVDTISVALFAPRPSYDDAGLRMVVALAMPSAATLTDITVWDALPEDLFPPPGWVAQLARTTEGLLFLLDPLRSPVALRLLRMEEVRDILEGPQKLKAWLHLVAPLFTADPEAAADLLARIVRHAVDVTRAHAAESFADVAAQLDVFTRKDDGWQDDVRILLAGAAAATRLPEARRHHRVVRAALREAMRGWESLADAPTFHSAWTNAHYGTALAGGPPLVTLLALCYAPAERVRFLRTADGHLSPFWDACVRAGVPFEEALRLRAEVASGRIPARPGFGAPTEMEVLHHRNWNADMPGPSAEASILDTLVEISSPEEIARLPGFTDPASGKVPADALVARYLEYESVRAYLWGFVSTLEEVAPIWLLLRRRVYSVRFEEQRGGFGRGGFADAFRDRAGLLAAIALVPSSSLTPAQWERLANAALFAGVPDAALAPLLGSAAVGAAREGLLLEVVGRLLETNRDLVRAWLLARLEDTSPAVDRPAFAPIWKGSGIDPTLLERWLAVRNDQPRGEGLVRALVLLGRERFGEWLADTGTRDAALGALAMSEDWPRRLAPALAASATIPSGAVLAHLLVQPGGVGFDVLDEAAASWPPDRRRALWEAAAVVAKHRWHRTEVWRRLA